MFVSIASLILIFRECVHSEWIEISQSSKSIRDGSLAIDRSMLLSNVDLTKDFKNVKYEDLVDIIGPDFEKEFTKYSHEHGDNRFMGNTTNIEVLSDSPRGVEKFESSYELHVEPNYPVDVRNNQYSEKYDSGEFTTIKNPAKSVYSAASTPAPTVSTVIASINKKIMHTNPQHTTKKPPHSKKSPEKKSSDSGQMQTKIILKHIEYKPFDFSGILKYLRNMQNAFSFDAIQSIHDKIAFLEDFKDQMLLNIQDRLNTLWPSVEQQKKFRQKRWMMGGGHESQKDHKVDVPAMETALMTISFLTLAVFLIKLVLRVIHVIKSKHVAVSMMQLPTSSQSAEPPVKIIKKNRNARKLSTSSTDLQTVTNTITSIENLNTT